MIHVLSCNRSQKGFNNESHLIIVVQFKNVMIWKHKYIILRYAIIFEAQFPYSHKLHCVHSSLIEKTMTKAMDYFRGRGLVLKCYGVQQKPLQDLNLNLHFPIKVKL